MKSSLSCVLSIYSIIIATCINGNEIVKWQENPLIKQTMMNGSIVGNYKDTIYGISPSSKHFSNGTIKMNVTNGKITTFSYPESNGHDKFDGYGAPNSFVTINDKIYFINNNDASCSGQVLCESGDTHFSSFSMQTEKFTNDYIKIGNYESESLPCLTSLTTINKGKENHYLIIMGGKGNNYDCDNDDDDNDDNDDDKSSNVVMFYHLETEHKMCLKMNAPSHSFGCKVASDGYLYKFGGNTCQHYNSSDSYDHNNNQDLYQYQAWRLDLNTFNGSINSIKYNNWESIKIDLPILENPTILELKQDKLLYIIGGYNQETNKCTKDVYCLDINDKYSYPCNDKPQSLVEPHCFEAGIEANDRWFYLFDGTQLQFTANINTSSPTLSPTDTPSNSPTDKPSQSPTDKPSNSPTDKPTLNPSNAPSNKPSNSPTDQPSISPTDKPSNSPTNKPSAAPSDSPSNSPSDNPSSSPSVEPTGEPTGSPTISAPKSTQHSNSTNWIIIGCSIAAAVLLITFGVYCIVKRYKSRMNDQPLL